jgi:amphi-Trp domain-containing protein
VKIQKNRPKRDIEKSFSKRQFVAKLRRLADCIEQSKRFEIQLAGENISIPPTAIISIEHERGASAEEIEFQIKWPLEGKTKKAK